MAFDANLEQKLASDTFDSQHNQIDFVAHNIGSDKAKTIKYKATALLARRDYTLKELRKKLSSCGNEELVERVLFNLKENGLQSDERFCEAFIRLRRSQGKGPARIRQDLKLKGVSTDLIEHHLQLIENSAERDLRIVYENKYNGRPIQDQKDKAKRIRFLAARGFALSHIYPLVESS